MSLSLRLAVPLRPVQTRAVTLNFPLLGDVSCGLVESGEVVVARVDHISRGVVIIGRTRSHRLPAGDLLGVMVSAKHKSIVTHSRLPKISSVTDSIRSVSAIMTDRYD